MGTSTNRGGVALTVAGNTSERPPPAATGTTLVVDGGSTGDVGVDVGMEDLAAGADVVVELDVGVASLAAAENARVVDVDVDVDVDVALDVVELVVGDSIASGFIGDSPASVVDVVEDVVEDDVVDDELDDVVDDVLVVEELVVDEGGAVDVAYEASGGSARTRVPPFQPLAKSFGSWGLTPANHVW